MHLIPESWAHLHILVSVFPSVGLIFALGFYAAGFATNSETLKRTSLVAFGVLGLLAIPTYLSGDGAMDALRRIPNSPTTWSARITAGASRRSPSWR
jgi:hypothetical protein